MDISEIDIDNLRTAFFQKLADSGLTENEYHTADINRIKANGDWLRRFLRHHDNDQAEALKMLTEACKWRAEFGTNDITEKNINMTIVQEGSIFAHNRDKDGKALLIFKSKKHAKGRHNFDELKRVLVYWVERLDRENGGDMITVFFDMDGAGMGNMDMEFTKYIIGLFKSYYPYFLNYILILEMSWVLNAAFNVIKTWLPAKAVQKIKFLKKDKLHEFVEPSQQLTSWGGSDDYTFEFVPEVRVSAEVKKVHFADRSPVSEDSQSFPDAPSVDGSPAHNLTINPLESLQFAADNGEYSASVHLKNNDPGSVKLSYKIKTTSPEKFRVRPSWGMLAPGESAVVNVILVAGYETSSLHRDKFLIMTVPITPEREGLDNNELWKLATKEHRLRCSIPTSAMSPSAASRNGPIGDSDRQTNKLSNSILSLHHDVTKMSEEIRRIQIQQWILLLLVGLLTAFTIFLSRKDPVNVINAESAHDAASCYGASAQLP